MAKELGNIVRDIIDNWFNQDLTLFAIPVVVAVSDFIVKQNGNVCRCLGVLIFALKICNLLLERSLILFRESGGWDQNFLAS